MCLASPDDLAALCSELDDAGVTPARPEHEVRDSNGEGKTPWARAARVDEENTLARFDGWSMGMARKDCREPRG